jgi:hypothetical protein
MLDNCSPHFGEGVTKISDENNLQLPYRPPLSHHPIDERLPARAVPMNIVKSLRNVGISTPE